MTPITDRYEIQTIVRRIEAAFNQGADFTGQRPISSRGGSIDRQVAWHNVLGIWGAFGMVVGEEQQRYWNTFGTQDPRNHQSLKQAVQLSLPVEGINRRTGGLLGRDDRGLIYLLHSGNIGGGKSGLGKSHFHAHWNGMQATVSFNADDATYALVADIHGQDLARELAIFVKEVERIKGLRP